MADESLEHRTFNWPDMPRTCFGAGSPPHLNACVGWVLSDPRDMTGYIEGYRKAATALYSWAVETDTSPDYVVFPLAFLWRHHVELALKEIIAHGRVIEGNLWGFPPHHGPGRLWTEARPHIEQCGPVDAPELANVEASILEFEAIDPGSDGFRYPLGKDRLGSSMPNAPSLVNIRLLHDGLTAVANFLEGVRCELAVRRDFVLEEAARESVEA